MSHELTWLLVAVPAVSAAILLLGGKATNAWGHLLGTLAPLISFAFGVVLFIQMQAKPSDNRAETVRLFEWFSVGQIKVEFSLLIDPLSILFVLLITGVGSLIHIYSIGYMEHDERRRRFFGYLNLFIASMLLLVLAADYLLVFVGWEGVGLASYLLIGFWQYKTSAAVAAKKAFVVNRVGDIGLSLAVMSMWALFGSSAFATVNAGAEHLSKTWATLLGLMLLLAACGKSAQVPLQSWLLDAMEGPTPVSALIHAATMVTAGVYLVVRSHAIFEQSDAASTAVVIVGTVTALAGAIIGCAKDDIKKALAGSTMSQIGYMMLAAGLGPVGYVFAIFHLLTHGFFKANMFLGAGSVMHGMNDDVNMRRYGALRKYLRITYVTFAFGYLAILGIPPFSGFFSKDKIIEVAFADNTVVGLCALLGAGITAFYMTRLMMMTFFGEKRWEEDVHPHESPKVMTGALVVLAILSLVGGALYFVGHWIVKWLTPVTGFEEAELPISDVAMSLIILAVVLVGAGVGVMLFRRDIPRTAPVRVSPVTTFARRDLYGDALNEALFMRPGQYLTRTLVWLDNRGVDGLVNGLAALFGGLSGRLRRVQTGFVRSYALSMVFGAAFVVVALLAVRLS
ncbi:NADH dehydrogenase subunit L [Kribbella rubisoli]|uniref:NADH dehydrogenase subunit L n=1 Tax=Kribbella rubisoli TaxID=3075929 RepID=A0A4Q7XA96_9ACTN|nr:NADH-quinone oxidoreductase subunit L [Kribbella rubisoli]RZU19733.1 NADH dehydrogenase subunit L [Kribbella rubisoli]